MSCYHPMKALDFGVNESTGKRMIKVISGEYNEQRSVVDGVKIISIPCGKCIGCRLEYSRVWADRCMLEAKYHKDNIFLTLTYEDRFLPECLEGSQVHPLRKRDLQLFIKRLRSYFSEQKIRYYACGEYSPKMRPHYHLIIFGLRLEDLKLHHRDPKTNYLYYVSESISKLWTYGFHIITDVTWETCAYTARYVMKKQVGINSSIYDDLNYPPEFTLMSRKPGIAYDFFKDNPSIVVRDFYLSTNTGSKRIRSNRYFDKLFDIEYHDDMDYIKDSRQDNVAMNEYLKSELTSLDYISRKHSEELVKAAQIKALKRKEL